MVLGVALLVLAPFGILLVLAFAMAGMTIGHELTRIPGLMVALMLFLLGGEGAMRARLWPALRWAAWGTLAGTVPLVALVLLGGAWFEALGPALLRAALWVDTAWLLPLALLAWRGGPRQARLLGPVLAAVVATSRLLFFPLVMLVGVFSNPDGLGLLIALPLAAGLALGMLMLLLLGALLALPLQALRRWLRPTAALAALALLALAVQLLRLGLLGAGQL